jgi:hypothetical protein
MAERKKTKRKVDLVSSHSDRERDEGPLAACSTEGPPAEALYKDRTPTFLKYHPKAGETVIYEDIYIPDVDP